MKARVLNVKACRHPSVEDALQQSVVAEKLAAIPDTDPSSIKDTATLAADWTSICDCLKEAAVEMIGHRDKKHQDWFDDINGAIRVLLSAKNEAHAAKLRNPHSADLHDKWKDLRSTAQRRTNGGSRKPIRFNSTLTTMSFRSFTKP